MPEGAKSFEDAFRTAESKATLCTIDEVLCNRCGKILQRSYVGGSKAMIYGCPEHDPGGKYELGVTGLQFSPRLLKIEGLHAERR